MKICLEVILWTGGAIALVIAFWNIQFQWRLRKHLGMCRDDFLEYFVGRGINTEIAAAIYDYYRPRAIWRNFGLSPEDEIAVLFNQAEEDLEVDFEAILKRLDLSMPSDEAWDSRSEPQVKTVEALVRAIAWAKNNQPKPWPQFDGQNHKATR